MPCCPMFHRALLGLALAAGIAGACFATGWLKSPSKAPSTADVTEAARPPLLTTSGAGACP